MIRKSIFTIFSLFSVLLIKAQELDLPTYINHMADNHFLISPSYAGIGSGFQLRLNGVSQWVGIDNAPDTQSLTAEARFTEKLGGGITLYNDNNGFTSQQGVRASAAYHLTLSDVKNEFFSFAFGARFAQFSINTDNFAAKDPSDPTPSISNSAFNFDVSGLYRIDRFAVSFNIVNILNKNVENILTGEPETLRRYSLYPVYTMKIASKLEFEPSMFIEYFEADGRSKSDLNAKIRKKTNGGYVWGGLSYTFLNDQFLKPNAIAPLFGMKQNKIYFSYGMSFTLNEIANYNFGTHMITLGFDYDPKPSLARCTKDMILFE